MKDNMFGDDDNKLPGQMRYDELLFNDDKSEQKRDYRDVVINGQISLDKIINEKIETKLKNETQQEKTINSERQAQQEQNENIIEDKIIQQKNQKSETQKIEETMKEKDKQQNNKTTKNQADKVLERFSRAEKELEEEIQKELKRKMAQNPNKEDVVEKVEEEKHTEHTIFDNQNENKKREQRKEEKLEVVDGIVTKSIDDVFHDSMIPYTEHVVMDRALPRVEDGLKPGQRRILYSMLELGLSPDKQYRKSARIVGDCMGKYHPHGDSSVYDAMVRMSQDFSLREPLVDGHGNFGSIDGDGAAAMRYTEAKLTPLAMELLRDLDKNTVRWSYNFDDTLKEPDMLPGRFPNLLVNGASGIAVGVATNIPPHNLSEVIDGVVAYIDKPKITLEEMMTHIKAPDFPTGGVIIAGDELFQAYKTGKGKIILRAKTHIEEDGDRHNIVITELPYQVNKALLLQKIAELKELNKDKLAAIGEIRDESDRKGMRAVIRIKKDGNAEAILDFLYKSTNMHITFGINMVAIAGGKPNQMGLLDIISYYTEYQRQIIYKRTKFDLDEAKDRAHIVEGLLVAIKNIDEVIRIIKKSQNVGDAKANLMKRFGLSDKQAQAILDMRLARLVNLEVTKLEQELKELLEKIEKLTLIVNSKERQLKVVKTEILEIKKQYGNKRRSSLISSNDFSQPEIDEKEAFARDVMVAMTADGGLKKISIKNYQLSQKSLSESATLSDVHTKIFCIKTHEKIMVFTNKGNILKINVDSIPDTKWRDKSVELIAIERNAVVGEKAIAIMPIEENENTKLIFFTKQGMVKVSSIMDYQISKSLFQAIKLKEDDELINVEYFDEESNVLLITKKAMALRFDNKEVPPQNRISSGVRGINLDDNDYCIFGGQVGKIGAITIVTNKGFAKKLPIGTYDVMARYRKGLRCLTWKENGDNLVFANFSTQATAIAVFDGKRFKVIENKQIVYDGRVAKGKQVIKKNLTMGYIFVE